MARRTVSTQVRKRGGGEQLQPAAERIAVILPAYNEEQTIGDTLRAFHRELPEAALYVVDNNSSDRTAVISGDTLRELGARGETIGEPRRGKGNALRCAFQKIEADLYLIADADMTYPSEQARELLAPIREDRADMVVGDRFSKGRYASQNKRPFHNFGNRLVRSIVNLLYAGKLTDILSGYRAFSRRFVKSYPARVEGFQVETDMTLYALQHRFRIQEVPVAYRERPLGSKSKLRTFSDGAKILQLIAQRLRHDRPLLFYSILASLSAGCGLLAALPALTGWSGPRSVLHALSLVLAAMLAAAALILLGSGMILHTREKTAHERLAQEQEEPETPTRISGEL